MTCAKLSAMESAIDPRETESGAELGAITQRRLLRAAILANGLGGLAVFTFALLAPGSPDREDGLRLAVANAATFVFFMAIAFTVGNRWARRAAEPLADWLLSGRAATPAEQDLALSYPARLTETSARIWVAAAVVFTAVNATYSLELAATAGVVTLLGGTTCCAILYLLTERATRPVVARALAGRAPPRSRGPSVAARLTMAWTLVTGVPLLGIAAIVIADLAGTQIGTAATVSMLFLALVGLGVGLAATVMAARSVGDPVRAVQKAMASVERGEFDARVHVDDGSEVGQLQAGFNRMAAGLADRERLRDMFGRQVGHDVARAALDGELRLGGEEREVAILFVDVVGSTTLATRLPPTDVVALLNAFFHVVVETVERRGGWVNKFEGDAALCVFGAPTARADPTGDALAAARELRDRLVVELPELDAGIGVSGGPAVAGNVGSEQRFEYTVIGDPVNEAARLCEIAKKRPERVLASDAALERSREAERDHWSLGEEVELRGRATPTRLATVKVPAARIAGQDPGGR
jgi:adenylate cyclase